MDQKADCDMATILKELRSGCSVGRIQYCKVILAIGCDMCSASSREVWKSVMGAEQNNEFIHLGVINESFNKVAVEQRKAKEPFKD